MSLTPSLMSFSDLIPKRFKPTSKLSKLNLTPEGWFNEYYGPLLLKYLNLDHLVHIIAVGSHAAAIIEWEHINMLEYVTCTCECSKVQKMHVHMLAQCTASRGQKTKFFAKLNKSLNLKCIERSSKFQRFIHLKDFGHVVRCFVYITREQSYYDKGMLGEQCKHSNFTPYGDNAYSINGCVSKLTLWNEIVHPYLSSNGYQDQVIAAQTAYEDFKTKKNAAFLARKVTRPTRARVSRPFSQSLSQTEETSGPVTLPIRGKLTAKLRDWAELIRASPEMALRLIDTDSKRRIVSFLQSHPTEIMGGLQVLVDEQRPQKAHYDFSWLQQCREESSSEGSDSDDMDNGDD